MLRTLILLLNRRVCRSPILCSFVFIFLCFSVYDFIINTVIRVQWTDRTIQTSEIRVLQSVLVFRYFALIEKWATRRRLRSKKEVHFLNFHTYKNSGEKGELSE